MFTGLLHAWVSWGPRQARRTYFTGTVPVVRYSPTFYIIYLPTYFLQFTLFFKLDLEPAQEPYQCHGSGSSWALKGQLRARNHANGYTSFSTKMED